jgi:hypothetical protein
MASSVQCGMYCPRLISFQMLFNSFSTVDDLENSFEVKYIDHLSLKFSLAQSCTRDSF